MIEKKMTAHVEVKHLKTTASQIKKIRKKETPPEFLRTSQHGGAAAATQIFIDKKKTKKFER